MDTATACAARCRFKPRAYDLRRIKDAFLESRYEKVLSLCLDVLPDRTLAVSGVFDTHEPRRFVEAESSVRFPSSLVLSAMDYCLANDKAYMIAHSHPFGCQPSERDVGIAKKLFSRADEIGLPILCFSVFGKRQGNLLCCMGVSDGKERTYERFLFE